MMAAITGIRSGAAAGIRTTKGLFFFFTLLVLICFTSSLSQDDQLEEIKINHQKVKEKFAKMNNMVMPAFMASSDMMADNIQLFDRMIAIMKKVDGKDEDFLLLKRSLKELRALLKQNMDVVNDKMDAFSVELREQEQNINYTDSKLEVLKKQKQGFLQKTF
uniref:Uncharacterized protein n=1 Tax=Iconisemion striatum TaxID=60296 RepID=A0A1A7YGE9_9TELE